MGGTRDKAGEIGRVQILEGFVICVKKIGVSLSGKWEIDERFHVGIL